MKSEKKPLIPYYFILAIFFLLVSSCSSQENNTINWDEVKNKDKAVLSPEWNEPVHLSISNLGWIESICASLDGKNLWYMYYVGKDLWTDARTGNFVENDVDIYTSKEETNGDFINHTILENPSIASHDRTAASGVMVDIDGNVWYNSNHEALTNNDWDTENIYKNNELLPFNNLSVTYGNPHYCEEKDELWFDGIADKELWILKDAAKNNFSGVPEIAPIPINSENEKVINSQAWLSKSGNTIYFTSNRHKVGQIYDGPGIFKSFRQTDNSWSEPKLIVTSKVAIGDACLNEQETKLFFVQYFEKDNQFRTGIFYTTLKK